MEQGKKKQTGRLRKVLRKVAFLPANGEAAVESQKMVKKGSLDNQISKEQFVFLASLNKHPNAFFVENYYMDGDGIGCLVVESLNGRFQSWLNYQVDTKNKQPSAPTLFTADGRMLPIVADHHFAVIKDHIGFLKKMEEWTPMIWANLYETIDNSN
ncbi:hypothetical protein D1007_55861 [Hordeum vulgare]|nr:hypothetical protein D1007_55861 [Hordeum vulgare]